MTDELYINGVRVDMAEDSGVYLDFESGILSSLDTISANYSYTIKLPKTATNMRVIGGLFFPTSSSTFPSARNVASLFRDGVPIVQGATLNLLAVNDDEIQVTVSWGVADVLDGIDDRSIRNLTHFATDANDVFAWILSNCPRAFYGAKRTVPYIDEREYYHPVYSVPSLMEHINDDAGGVLVYDSSLFANFVIPILLRVPFASSHETLVQLTGIYALLYNNSGIYSRVTLLMNIDAITLTGDVFTGITLPNSGEPYNGYYVALRKGNADSVKVNIEIVATYSGSGRPSPIRFCRCYESSSDSEMDAMTLCETSVSSGENGRYTFTYLGYELEGGAGGMFGLCCDSASQLTFQSVNFEIVDDAEEESDEDAKPNDEMRYSENLPDISCKDFIKGICGMFGLFPQLYDGAVYLVKYSDMAQHSYGVVDWSNKLLQTSDVPREMSLSPDGMARRNYFKYTNDDDVPETSSYIGVDDNALDKETDFLTSAFKGGANSTSKGATEEANIVLYTQEEGNEWEYDEDDGCYVLENVSNTLNFYGWGALIERYYSLAVSMFSGRVITEYFDLDVVDLKDLDLRKVVYLRQYGAYFAIMEVKTKDNYSEVKLLTL